ncbi:hypothetical protein PAXINDRAFT_96340 [Paxillus involutus ATCC 200175]|nr:hypothetical protein PAXINDRAFT_96340 [Paxillus involutus ATCC 200175]
MTPGHTSHQRHTAFNVIITAAMNSTSESAVSTTKYRLSLPFALHSISPALSALHATRASVLHPELSSILHPSHCAKCGAYYFSGDGSSHVFGRLEKKTKKKKRKRASAGRKNLQIICPTCGCFTDLRSNHVEPTFSPHSNIPQSSVSVQPPSASSSVDTTLTRMLSSTTKTLEPPEPSVSLNPMVRNLPEIAIRGSSPPFPKQLPHNKSSRTKTTSTLQDMLSHNRRRDEVLKAHGKTKDSHGGWLLS